MTIYQCFSSCKNKEILLVNLRTLEVPLSKIAKAQEDSDCKKRSNTVEDSKFKFYFSIV